MLTFNVLAYMDDLQNSKYLLIADRNEDIPFRIFEPGAKCIAIGAGRLILSSSAVYLSNFTRFRPPSFLYSSSRSNPKLFSILRQRLIQSETERLEILPCNQLRKTSIRILITSIVFYTKKGEMYLIINNDKRGQMIKEW